MERIYRHPHRLARVEARRLRDEGVRRGRCRPRPHAGRLDRRGPGHRQGRQPAAGRGPYESSGPGAGAGADGDHRRPDHQREPPTIYSDRARHAAAQVRANRGPGPRRALRVIGEPPTIVSTAAVVAALRAATGRELTRVPVRPDDVSGEESARTVQRRELGRSLEIDDEARPAAVSVWRDHQASSGTVMRRLRSCRSPGPRRRRVAAARRACAGSTRDRTSGCRRRRSGRQAGGAPAGRRLRGSAGRPAAAAGVLEPRERRRSAARSRSRALPAPAGAHANDHATCARRIDGRRHLGEQTQVPVAERVAAGRAARASSHARGRRASTSTRGRGRDRRRPTCGGGRTARSSRSSAFRSLRDAAGRVRITTSRSSAPALRERARTSPHALLERGAAAPGERPPRRPRRSDRGAGQEALVVLAAEQRDRDHQVRRTRRSTRPERRVGEEPRVGGVPHDRAERDEVEPNPRSDRHEEW